MAMLILPDVFERTWGRKALEFWPIVTKAVREHVPDFCFMAEVYWDMEWTLQQQGFDYAYDKRLYDRLREGNVPSIRGHFHAGLGGGRVGEKGGVGDDAGQKRVQRFFVQLDFIVFEKPISDFGRG
jgi:hypothetical protein